jgi:uncharacterized protein YjiS (DUF1127 family)
MRNFVFTQARARSGAYYLPKLRIILRNLKRRRGLLELQRLDAHQLRDIGLTPADLTYLGSLPLTPDLDWERERLRLLASRKPTGANRNFR